MRVIFYHVGKGDMSLVLLPNGEAMMVDCFKATEVARGELSEIDDVLDRVEKHILEHREQISKEIIELAESVVKERDKKKKIPIAVLAITHADRDHITARKKLHARFEIGQLVDSGREYNEASEATKDYLKFRKEMKEAGKYLAINEARYDVWQSSGATIDVLCPNRKIGPDEDANNQCLVIRVSYKGMSFLFTGDSPLDDWTNEQTGIVKLHIERVPSDVLNVSHHGSRTFFTPPGPHPEGQPEYKKEEFDTKALKRISPMLSFITCSDEEDAEHPHPIALELYQELTNSNLSETHSRKVHVILSRDSQHLHHVVDAHGHLYMRTSRSRTNNIIKEPNSNRPFLDGTVSSPNGYLTKSGIWVSRELLHKRVELSFSVKAKGNWPGPVLFDWWVLNNGQGKDRFHHEFYTMDSSDRKKSSTWTRELVYEGIHIMQCYAYTEDKTCWANWCVLVCQEQSLPYAERWLMIYPGCIDSSRINRRVI